MNAPLLIVAGALVYASVWRRRARQASDADLGAQVSESLTKLMTSNVVEDGPAVLAGWVVEGKTPPDPGKRWFYWVAATCTYCSKDFRPEVHDPQSGWETTRRIAIRRRDAFADWFVEDSDSCPVLRRVLAERLADGDDDDAAPDPA